MYTALRSQHLSSVKFNFMELKGFKLFSPTVVCTAGLIVSVLALTQRYCVSFLNEGPLERAWSAFSAGRD